MSADPPLRRWLVRHAEAGLTGAAALWFGWQGVAALVAGASPLVAALLLAGAGVLGAWSAAAAMRLRLRPRNGATGPGVVEIAEGRIGYWGPEAGGFVALDLIAEIAIVRRRDGPAWLLTQEDGAPLEIPAAAAGAEALPDVLGTLPGFATGTLAAALAGRAGPVRRVIWRRTRGELRLVGR